MSGPRERKSVGARMTSMTRRKFMGTAAGVVAAGAIVGPIIVSPFMTSITPYALFGWTAIFQVLLVVFVAYRMWVRGEVSETRRSSFVDALNEVQTILPIDTSKAGGQAASSIDESSTTPPDADQN